MITHEALAPPATAATTTRREHRTPMYRRQLPALSPVDSAALLKAAASLVGGSGVYVERLREELSRRYDAPEIILCASGTAALSLALRAAARDRDRCVVAIPGYACYDIATAVIGAGLQCVAYDLDPETLGPSLDSFDAALRVADCAVVAPLYGIPVDWTTLSDVARSHDTLLLEDAAQAHGAWWQDRRVGSFGTASVLSFGRGKGWTGGAGGALLVRDATLLDAARGMIPEQARPGAGAGALVRSAVQWLFGRPVLYGFPSRIPALGLGETRYHPPAPFDVMPRGAAALAVATMAASDAEVETRRGNAAVYEEALRDKPGVSTVRVSTNARPGFLRFPVRISGGGLAGAEAARAYGVGPSYPGVLTDLPALRPNITGYPTDLPGARNLVRTLVTLPTHSKVTVRDRMEVLRLLLPAEANG